MAVGPLEEFGVVVDRASDFARMDEVKQDGASSRGGYGGSQVVIIVELIGAIVSPGRGGFRGICVVRGSNYIRPLGFEIIDFKGTVWRYGDALDRA